MGTTFVMDYSDFYCCADCEYHFVDGDPKKRNPKQYLDCDHLRKEIVDGRLVCLRCGYEGEKEEIRDGTPPSNKCVHKRFAKNIDTVFCVNCGVEGPITFPPIWYWETVDNQYIPKGQKPVKKRRHTKPVVGEEPKEGGGKPEKDNEAEKDCGPEECGYDYQNSNESEKEGCKPDYQYPINDDNDKDDDKPKPVVKKRRKNPAKKQWRWRRALKRILKSKRLTERSNNPRD